MKKARARCSAPNLCWAIWGMAAVSMLPAVSPMARAAEKSDIALEKENAVQVPTVRVARGAQVTLPYLGVTQVMAEDDDVARVSFATGKKAVVEGVTLGYTLVEVRSGSKSRLVAIQVVEPGSAGTNVPPLPVETQPTVVTVEQTAPIQPVAPGVDLTDNGTTLVPAPLPHSLSLRVVPIVDNPLEALVTITYTNSGATPQDVTIRYPVPEEISYVSNSATGKPSYDAAARELSWKINTASGDAPQSVSFRVRSFDGRPVVFTTGANVTGADTSIAASNTVTYSFVTTPLLTVFALPNRILAGRNSEVLVDVKGPTYQAVLDRLQKMGVINGKKRGLFDPSTPTGRAEYAVMTLRGLNLHDLRDVTAIKFVLSKPSTVNLEIRNSKGALVTQLLKGVRLAAGEHTQLWSGLSGSEYVAPGTYTYVCTAKSNSETTKLSSTLTIVPQTPIEAQGQPSFLDVKKTDWFAGYLAIAEKQDLIKGYPGRLFRPYKPVSRVEAAAIVVRAMGLEDLARQAAGKDLMFLDYQDIEKWAVGYVNVAVSTKTSSGGVLMGYPSNMFLPRRPLRRDEAAIIVQRMIDKETSRRVGVSGQLAPGAIVTINSRTVQAQDNGQFDFSFEQNTTEPISIAVSR